MKESFEENFQDNTSVNILEEREFSKMQLEMALSRGRLQAEAEARFRRGQVAKEC